MSFVGRHNGFSAKYGGRDGLTEVCKQHIREYLRSNKQYRIQALLQHLRGLGHPAPESKVRTFVKNWKQRSDEVVAAPVKPSVWLESEFVAFAESLPRLGAPAAVNADLVLVHSQMEPEFQFVVSSEKLIRTLAARCVCLCLWT